MFNVKANGDSEINNSDKESKPSKSLIVHLVEQIVGILRPLGCEERLVANK